MPTRTEVLTLEVVVNSDAARRELDRFERKSRDTANKATRGAKGATQAYNQMRTALSRLGIAVSAAVLVRGFDSFIKQGQQAVNLARGFETLTGRVNETANSMLRQLRPAARGLVTDMELMRLTNNAILLGLPVTSDAMSEMTDVAIRLGRAMGVDATRAVESLSLGIARQSRLLLDNLGIVGVDFPAAYARYAKSLGVSVDELTSAQKQQAGFNETMEKARGLVQGLGDDVSNVGDEYQTLGVTVSNFFTKLRAAVAGADDSGGLTGLLGTPGAPGTLLESFLRQFGGEAIVSPLGGRQQGADLRQLQRLGLAPRGLSASNTAAEAALAASDAAAARERDRGLLLEIEAEEARRRRDAAFRAQLAAIPAPGGGAGANVFTGRPGEIDLLLGTPRAPTDADAGPRRLEARRDAELQATEQLLRAQLSMVSDFGISREALELQLLEMRQQQEIESFRSIGAQTLTLEEAHQAERTALHMEFVDEREHAELQSQERIRQAGADAAAAIGTTLVDAAFGAEVAWREFFKNLIADFIKAQTQALILQAFTGGVGGGFSTAGALFGFGGRQGGGVIQGVDRGFDSQLTPTRPGERILTVEQNRAFEAGRLLPGSGGAVTLNLTVNALDTEGVEDSVRRLLENSPEALAAGIRRAREVGAFGG